MFGRRTVDSVVARLQGIVDDLVEVRDERLEEIGLQQKIEFTASVAGKEAQTDAARAGRVADKLKELLA